MSFWIFQAVPRQYDLKKELVARKFDFWRVTRLRKEMKKDDSVLFWQAGKQSGFYGAGNLESDPYPSGEKNWRVDVKYTHQFEPPILKSRLLNHNVLKNLRILKPPFQGTNFRATKEQWEALGLINREIESDEVEVPLQFFEGATQQISVNAYERNREARQECLKHYGYRCSVCEFDFEKFYGSQGSKFIHVHHLKQLSEIGKKYQVDPILDLCPVCPNCHAMIHKGSQMLSIEALKQLIRK